MVSFSQQTETQPFQKANTFDLSILVNQPWKPICWGQTLSVSNL
ncbi:MAG: hypothetical protein OJF50_005321 [Nitrospira sp.]|nr:hypothetical protein [Nitrospira sp.]